MDQHMYMLQGLAARMLAAGYAAHLALEVSDINYL
jgi:hypothetical protein